MCKYRHFGNKFATSLYGNMSATIRSPLVNVTAISWAGVQRNGCRLNIVVKLKYFK